MNKLLNCILAAIKANAPLPYLRNTLDIGHGLVSVTNTNWTANLSTTGSRVKSVTVMVQSGTASISASESPALTVGAGFTATWTVEGSLDVLRNLSVSVPIGAVAIISWTEEL